MISNQKVMSDSPSRDQNRGQHLFWVDVLRVFAAFAVVLIHSGFSRPGLGSAPHTFPDILIATVSIIARPAVVWFFLLSGALLLAKEEPLGLFASKRLLKIAVPLLFWSSFYLALTCLTSETGLPHLNWDLLTGGAFYHLWFLHALFVIYLTFPLLRKFCNRLDLMLLFILIWGTWAYLIPLAAQAFGGPPANFSYDGNYLVSYIGYPVLGLLLSKNLAKIPLWLIITIWLSTTAIILASVANFRFSFNIFYSYKSPLILFYACIGFTLIQQIPAAPRNATIARLFNLIAPCTFGIYLIHPLILRLLNCLPSQDVLDPFTLILIKATVAFLVSATCVYLIRMTAPGRWVSP